MNECMVPLMGGGVKIQFLTAKGSAGHPLVFDGVEIEPTSIYVFASAPQDSLAEFATLSVFTENGTSGGVATGINHIFEKIYTSDISFAISGKTLTVSTRGSSFRAIYTAILIKA